jgi:hypothetical protein
LQAAPFKLSITTTAARSLSITAPAANAEFAIGDAIDISWTSDNIDSLYLAAYSYSQGGVFMITNEPIAASLGTYQINVPHEADTGNYDFILLDSYDTSFRAVQGPIHLVDNRQLDWVFPQNGDTAYVGDTLTLTWTSSGIDSVLIGGYISGDKGPGNGYFMLTGDPDHYDTSTFRPVPASAGVFKIYLDPQNMGGSITIDSMFVFDAADLQFKDVSYPVYILDTFPMRIVRAMPSFGMTDYPASQGISCDFNCDSIVKGAGSLHLKKADGSTVEDVDVNMVQFFGNGIWFMPNPALEVGETYYIEIDSGFVKCADGSKTYPGLSGQTWTFTIASSSLYFSEYIEGSSNNKALEIYNPTDHDINLDEYAIVGSYNGSGINDDNDMYRFPQGYVLQPGAVFVLANASATNEILAVANDTLAYNEGGYVCGFNGDDSRVLIRIIDNGNDRLWIDQIGNPWEDPGSGWDVAGVSAATKDHTLLRKRNVMVGTTDWGRSAGSNADDSQWIVEAQNTFDNLGLPTPAGSDKAEIIDVMLMNDTKTNVTTHTEIHPDTDSVFVEVLAGTDVTNMYADINVSAGAEITPGPNEVLDFTNPLQFTVTAENGIASKVWTIKVTVAAAQSSEADIQDFNIPGMVGDETIDWTAHTVDVLMPYGTDLSNLTPTIEISVGATISPESGVAMDFSSPVAYQVTAQDGTVVNWTVTVTTEQANVVKIKDIQMTADASGDSPLLGQIVQFNGVVTALNIYKGTFKGYYVQDTVGAWSGIYVYDGASDFVAVGDSVTVVGTVSEYYNLTEVSALNPATVLASGVNLPEAVVVNTGDASDEQWESVLLQFKDASCTKTDRGHGEMEVDDGSGMAVVDDYLFAYDPFVLNDVYTITGVMTFGYGEFKLAPRSADDITDVTGISENALASQVSLYPNPGNGIFNIALNGTLKGSVNMRIVDITGRVVLQQHFDHVSGSIPVNISNETANLYFITLRDENHTIVKKFMKK